MDRSARNKELLESARRNLANVQAAYDRATQAQSWSTENGMGRRSVQNADIGKLWSQLLYWKAEVQKLEAICEGRGGSAFRVMPTL